MFGYASCSAESEKGGIETLLLQQLYLECDPVVGLQLSLGSDSDYHRHQVYHVVPVDYCIHHHDFDDHSYRHCH